MIFAGALSLFSGGRMERVRFVPAQVKTFPGALVPRHSGEGGNPEGLADTRGRPRTQYISAPASLQNQDLQDFDFARLALFATTENPANPNTDGRLPTKDELAES